MNVRVSVRSTVTKLSYLALGLTLAALSGCQRYVAPNPHIAQASVDSLRKSIGAGASAETAAPVASATPTGWATIKGTFKINGGAPERTTLTISGSDQAVCAPGGKTVFGESIVVDPASGGIKDVVVYLNNKKFPADDPAWVHESYAATADGTLEFDQKACVFLTHMLAMRSTQKLKILNSDPVGHNTNIQASGRASQFNQNVPSGGSVVYEPGGESNEPFPVSCSIHPWMSARMLVRSNPYFAVSKPDGTFEIANVPAGVPLEFKVWQEAGGFLSTVELNGSSVKWNKGNYTVTLQSDEVHEMNVVVPADVLKK